MHEKADHEYSGFKVLRPWQAEFAHEFLSSKRERYWELVAPPGSGKTRLAAGLIAHELKRGLHKRILVLVPSTVLVLAWQSALLSLGSPFTKRANKPLVVGVDRRTFLELESNTPKGESPWPVNAVILMNIDLAKRDDIATSLGATTWDLVVFDEAHAIVGRTLFNRLLRTGAINRALLLTSIEGRAPISNAIHRVSVSLSDLANWREQPLFPPFKAEITWIYYRRSKEERVFLKEFEKFAEQLTNAWSYTKLEKAIVQRVASSSMYATKGMLQHFHSAWRLMRNKVAHGFPWADEDIQMGQTQLRLFADELGIVPRLPRRAMIEPQEFLRLFQTLESLLDQIEEIPTDPKLDAAVRYIRQYRKAGKKPHLCILSSFEDTVHYLESTLQDIGIPVYCMTYRTEFRERIDRTGAFQSTGGLLVLTDACSEGMNLSDIEACIHYDLPLDKDRFLQRLGRFARFGRKADLKMISLRDESKALSWEEDISKEFEGYFPLPNEARNV